jgi:saccharopine dehydrogenase-like NADP-dependent oxidoreductase
MAKSAVVLGCGLVGATMARELARSGMAATVADVSDERLRRVASDTVKTQRADLSDRASLQKTIAPFDIVLGALPSRFGLATLESVIRASKNYCDISFMPEDPLALDPLAKEKGVTAIVDCGVSPGLSNLMVGYAAAQLDHVERAEIYVGGLPKVRRWPYEYKAPFAPSDVIEEYTRPARMVENGREVVKPALSEPELIHLSYAGTLEAFNTDGLRTLLRTVKADHMKEKTMRFPGHAELMRVLRETGFFSQEPIDIGGARVRPLDVTSKMLFPRWTLDEGEEEFTVLRVFVEGTNGGRGQRFTFDLYDEYDKQRGESSMARTTAFPNVIAAIAVAEGRISDKGVFAPEVLGKQPGLFEHFITELQKRGVKVTWKLESPSHD